MAKQSGVNLDITNNTDGFDLSGGTTKRKAAFTGADQTFTGSGANVYTFPPAGTCTLANAAIAVANVTASRALNTTYANPNTVQSVLVIATVRCAITLATGTAYVQAKADTSSPPTTIATGKVGIEAGLLNEDNTFQISFVVPAGTTQNYRLDSTAVNGSVTLQSWFEYTL